METPAIRPASLLEYRLRVTFPRAVLVNIGEEGKRSFAPCKAFIHIVALDLHNHLSSEFREVQQLPRVTQPGS